MAVLDTYLDHVREDEDRDHDRDLDEDLMEAVRDHVCPRCHYDTDEDGFCSTCGATCGRA